MRITIIKTIDVSEENLPLLPVVAGSIGYDGGDLFEFITDFLKTNDKNNLKLIVEPPVTQSFGGVLKEKAAQVAEELDNAIKVEVVITQ